MAGRLSVESYLVLNPNNSVEHFLGQKWGKEKKKKQEGL